MTLFDLDFEGKLGKYTALGFYNNGENLIDIVVSGSKTYVQKAIITLLDNCDGLCFTMEQGDLEESTDTQYIIEGYEEE